MTDELRERLARVDPMRAEATYAATTPPRELMERIMNTPVIEDSRPVAEPRRRRTWAFAAVAAMVLAVASGLAFSGGSGLPSAAGPPLELDAGGDDALASCIAFSAEELERVAEIAFAGTVTEVDGPTVTLTVDKWYRGGDAETVVLNAPLGMEALIGGVPFEVGGEFLVSAQAGNVNYCGFSGPATPEYTSAFEAAFANG